MDNGSKKRVLSEIMGKVHALADIAWPRDDVGASNMPMTGLDAMVDIQAAVAKALGIKGDTSLMSGDPRIDDLT